MASIENATSTIVYVGCDTVLLFESLRGVPGNKRLKGCELKDSFMGGEEADLCTGCASRRWGFAWRSSVPMAAR